MAIHITPDDAKRRIVIEVDGAIDWRGAIAARKRLQDIVDRWDGPFDVVTDIRRAVLKDTSGQLAMQETQSSLRDAGMRYVVRVISVADQVAAQFRRGERRSGYVNQGEVFDMESAHRLLDRLADEDEPARPTVAHPS